MNKNINTKYTADQWRRRYFSGRMPIEIIEELYTKFNLVSKLTTEKGGIARQDIKNNYSNYYIYVVNDNIAYANYGTGWVVASLEGSSFTKNLANGEKCFYMRFEVLYGNDLVW